MRRAGVRVVSLITCAIVGSACGESDSITEDRTINGPATASIATIVASVPTSTGSPPTTAADAAPTPSLVVSTSPLGASTAAPEGLDATVAEQAAVYEVVIRDVYGRTQNDRPRGAPGVLLVDHSVAGAGQAPPLSISASASGEPFSIALKEELSRRLVDVPLLDFVGSMEEVLGPDYHPTATGGARPGCLVVVSPISRGAGRATMGVQVGPPGGAGWEYVLDVGDGTAAITDAGLTWIS